MEVDNNKRSPKPDVVTHRTGGDIIKPRRVVQENTFDYEGWKIIVMKSTILPSKCYCESSTITTNSNVNNVILSTSPLRIENEESSSSSKMDQTGNPTLCQVCRFDTELSLKHLPEMVFPDNVLRIVFQESGFTLEFNALDAMKLISDNPDTVHVACAEIWKAAQEREQLQQEIKYDWTYSTNYKGTLKLPQGKEQTNFDTDENLNLEKLKEREKILFYEELSLYEDELHDNGTSNLSLKIRVMPSGFFILLRFFLRVDDVMAKICDTRVYYEKGNNYLLRQFQERKEVNFQTLSHLPSQTFTDPNILYPYLPVVAEKTEKIHIV